MDKPTATKHQPTADGLYEVRKGAVHFHTCPPPKSVHSPEGQFLCGCTRWYVVGPGFHLSSELPAGVFDEWHRPDCPIRVSAEATAALDEIKVAVDGFTGTTDSARDLEFALAVLARVRQIARRGLGMLK